jgi:hypothetical protein
MLSAGTRISPQGNRLVLELVVNVRSAGREVKPAKRLVLARLLFNTGKGYRAMGKGLLLWLLGIPIPVIILLYLFHVV